MDKEQQLTDTDHSTIDKGHSVNVQPCRTEKANPMGRPRPKTDEERANEKLRKRASTLFGKIDSFDRDCRYYACLVLVDKSDPARIFEYASSENSRHFQTKFARQRVTKHNLRMLNYSRHHWSSDGRYLAQNKLRSSVEPNERRAPEPIGRPLDHMRRSTETGEWNRVDPPQLERSPVEREDPASGYGLKKFLRGFGF